MPLHPLPPVCPRERLCAPVQLLCLVLVHPSPQQLDYDACVDLHRPGRRLDVVQVEEDGPLVVQRLHEGRQQRAVVPRTPVLGLQSVVGLESLVQTNGLVDCLARSLVAALELVHLDSTHVVEGRSERHGPVGDRGGQRRLACSRRRRVGIKPQQEPQLCHVVLGRTQRLGVLLAGKQAAFGAGAPVGSSERSVQQGLSCYVPILGRRHHFFLPARRQQKNATNMRMRMRGYV